MTSIVAPAATLTGTYSIDQASSTIGFAARGAVGKVRGTFNEFSGTGYFDAEDPTRSHVELTIRAGSVDTRDARRDQHLRNADFFSVDEFPQIRFVSTTVESIDPWSQRVTGDLTIKSVTRPITVDFELTGATDDPFGNQRIGFEGTAVLNRKDWDVTWNQTLDSGGIIMGNKVTLELEISAVRAADDSQSATGRR
jgi:polyisoprenoid-binding protein YceI